MRKQFYVILFLSISIIIEIIIIKNHYIKKDDNNSKANKIDIMKNINNAKNELENLLSPLTTAEEIFCYKIFDLIPAYVILIIIVIAYVANAAISTIIPKKLLRIQR